MLNATASRYSSLVVRRRDATMPAMLRKNAAAMSGRSRCTLAKLCRDSTWNSLASVVRADRKSTRLNSSHDQISYAVFCLKKKNNPTSVDMVKKEFKKQKKLTKKQRNN